MASYDVTPMMNWAAAGVPVGRLLRTVTERNCPAGPEERPEDRSQISRDAMPLAANDGHESVNWNSLHGYFCLALHRGTRGSWAQNRDDHARTARGRDRTRYVCADWNEHAGPVHQSAA